MEIVPLYLSNMYLRQNEGSNQLIPDCFKGWRRHTDVEKRGQEKSNPVVPNVGGGITEVGANRYER
jgi:hypothetical protein